MCDTQRLRVPDELFRRVGAGEALEALHAACRAWHDMEAPYEATQVRVLIAVACGMVGDPDTAELEYDAARAVFERLGAGAGSSRQARRAAILERCQPFVDGNTTVMEPGVLVASGRQTES